MRLFIHALLILFIKPVMAQTDTVFCDAKNTSYIVFAEDISLCDVGFPEDYALQVKGNIVFVKALKEGVPATTILIKTGKEIYFGMLKYKINNQKYYYDYKGVIKKVNSQQSTVNNTNTIENSIVSTSENAKVEPAVSIADPALNDKMKEFLKIKNELTTLGFISSTVDAALTVIRNDNNNTFLKIVFKNKSSIPYKLDFISFQYYQDMKKGKLRKSKKAPIDVFPVGEPLIKEIALGKTEPLVYVIPSFALANNGYLMVLVRESSGDRVLKIKVDGSVIQQSGQMQLTNGK